MDPLAARVAAIFTKSGAKSIPYDAIKKLTNANNHTEALILGAKSLGMTQVVKKLDHVKALADIEGHMPHGLNQYRTGLHDEVMRHAKQELAPDEYQKFYMLF